MKNPVRPVRGIEKACASAGDAHPGRVGAAGNLGTLRRRTAAPAETTSAEHVLCVPLVAVERILGVIYLSSPASSPAFGEDHAYFVSSVSRIAAVTLENLSKLDSLRAENQRLRAEAKPKTPSSARAGRCDASASSSGEWRKAIRRC